MYAELTQTRRLRQGGRGQGAAAGLPPACLSSHAYETLEGFLRKAGRAGGWEGGRDRKKGQGAFGGRGREGGLMPCLVPFGCLPSVWPSGTTIPSSPACGLGGRRRLAFIPLALFLLYLSYHSHANFLPLAFLFPLCIFLSLPVCNW